MPEMPEMPDYLYRISLAEALGVGGFGLYVLAYALLTLGRIGGDDLRYYAMNGAAAVCVLIGLTVQFNLASAMIQVFWIVMSGLGIALRMIRVRASHSGRSPRLGGESPCSAAPPAFRAAGGAFPLRGPALRPMP
jgi:hypothetical protein